MTFSALKRHRLPLLAGMLLLANASGAWAQQRVGVSSAVNPQATGTPPGAAASRPLVIGQDVVFNERITTTTGGQTQLLFLDESSMSIGPDSDLTIDQFVYDPKSGTGKLAMAATRGLLRYVGGKLSKSDGAVTLRTNTATLAVRGGAFIVDVTHDGRTEVIFLYGQGLTVAGIGGIVQELRRPGYQITVSRDGNVSPPQPVLAADLARLNAQLDGRSGGNGGAAQIPTDASVDQSGISQTISGNLAQSLQEAVQNATTTLSQPTTVNPGSAQTSFNPQPNPVSQVIFCDSTGACSGPGQIGTITPTQPSGPPPPPPPPPPPNQTTTTFGGQVRYTDGNGTARGFVELSGNGDIPYATGTLSFPQGSPQDGVFSGSFGNLGTITFPLVPGTASFGPQGTSSSLGAFSGTSFLSADGTFFYAKITPTSQPTQRLFVFGGIPVSQSFYQPTGSTRIFAFSVQPDAALQSNMPFVRSQAGGNLPNAAVSPFYIVAPASTAIGNTSNGAGARGLQASLVINGQGANQQSAISVLTGTIGELISNGKPVFTGQLRGSSMMSANGLPVSLNGTVSSTVDGNGNGFYGGNSISGFVLDQSPSGASETTLSGSQTPYGFAQAALPTTAPSNVGGSRTTQTLSGQFGGLVYSVPGTPYLVNGNATISTNAADNSVSATFGNSGQNALHFGGAPAAEAFVDDNTFAATESPGQPNKLYLVSSGAAGAPTSLLPSGASFCQCAPYLQWGYWGGQGTASVSGGGTQTYGANINTWVVGVPTAASNLQSLESQSATATYSGAALGSVYNDGARYIAAGAFNGSYSFGSQTASMAITNFDGHNFAVSGAARLNGARYMFGTNTAGVNGFINGSFYGPNAAATGGSFAFQTTVGPTYMAGGTFAGARTGLTTGGCPRC